MTNIHKGDMDILLVEDDPSIGGFLQAAMDCEPGYACTGQPRGKMLGRLGKNDKSRKVGRSP